MSNEEQNKNYYAIIPAVVRYDKELPPAAKLMYGEIYALSNGKGYCWANNTYFAELYGVHKNTVSIWINLLIKKGYISTEIIYRDNSKYILERRLKALLPINENVDTLSTKTLIPYHEKQGQPINENIEDNNTINTKLNINIYTPVIDYLNSKCSTSYKTTSNKTKACIDARTNEGFVLEDFKKVIDIKSAEWLNTDMAKYLRPETLFGNKFESYLNQKEPIKEPIKQAQLKPKPNKFHNFEQHDDAIDLEALAEKRRAETYKKIKGD